MSAAWADQAEEPVAQAPAPRSSESNRYIPPHLRGKAASGGGGDSRDSDNRRPYHREERGGGGKGGGGGGWGDRGGGYGGDREGGYRGGGGGYRGRDNGYGGVVSEETVVGVTVVEDGSLTKQIPSRRRRQNKLLTRRTLQSLMLRTLVSTSKPMKISQLRRAGRTAPSLSRHLIPFWPLCPENL